MRAIRLIAYFFAISGFATLWLAFFGMLDHEFYVDVITVVLLLFLGICFDIYSDVLDLAKEKAETTNRLGVLEVTTELADYVKEMKDKEK